MSNIVNVLETIQHIEQLTEVGVRVFEDGKIGISDLSEVPEAFSAFKGIASRLGAAREEIKDLDMEEVQTISHELIRVIFGVVAYKEDAG